MSEYRNFLRTNLRSLRLSCGYTQENVADALGIARPTYSYYELGMTTPDIETVRKLAKIYGVPFMYLADPGDQPDVELHRRRAKHHPAVDPKTIGELTADEKVLIARLRSVEGLREQ